MSSLFSPSYSGDTNSGRFGDIGNFVPRGYGELNMFYKYPETYFFELLSDNTLVPICRFRLLLQMQRLVHRDLLRGERQPVFLQPLLVRRHLHCGQRRLRLPVQRTVYRSEVCRFPRLPSFIRAVALSVSSCVCAVSTFICSCRCGENIGFLCLFFPCPSGASLAPTAEMNLVKTAEHVLIVWMVRSVSVTQVLGEKGNWLPSRSVFAALCRVTAIGKMQQHLLNLDCVALEFEFRARSDSLYNSSFHSFKKNIEQVNMMI